jgi:hypothetical protein
MSPARWLVMVGCQACLWSLGAQEREVPTSRPRPSAEAFPLTGHDPWYCRMLERGGPRAAPPVRAASREQPPGRGEARAAPAFQGPRALVVEVPRIPLDYPGGTPVGTYR